MDIKRVCLLPLSEQFGVENDTETIFWISAQGMWDKTVGCGFPRVDVESDWQGLPSRPGPKPCYQYREHFVSFVAPSTFPNKISPTCSRLKYHPSPCLKTRGHPIPTGTHTPSVGIFVLPCFL